jgi:uncharacterized membrane protein
MRSLLLALALLPLLAEAAHADLRLCNRTSYILYAATARIAGDTSQIQGWTRLAPGDCQTAIKGALPPQGTFVYARTSLAHSGPQRAWGGKLPLCVRDADFSLRQKNGVCPAPDGFAVPFSGIDTKGHDDFTMTFDEQPALATLIAAQLAGAKRLLKDNGFAIAAINAKPDKITGKALATFRAAMHFDPAAGNDELFQALETQARKKTAPSGYTVCNDGKEELLVAMGESSGASESSQGWWRVAAGACARTVTTPLSSDAVWLLAQKTDGAPVTGGPDKFCIASWAFEIRKRGDCAVRGLGEAGFAKTPTRGLSFYVAHIGAKN